MVLVLKKNGKLLTLEEKEMWKNYVDNIPAIDKNSSSILKKSLVKTTISKENQIKRNNVSITETKVPKTSILIDKKLHIKLKNGRLKPERILDLHGYSYEKAFSQVGEFVKLAYRDEKRLILIITGKGNKSVDMESYFLESRRGILRHAVPTWLDSKSLNKFILNVTSAHFTHGGNGAYYVYLKKKS